jgi:hypothetical protein
VSFALLHIFPAALAEGKASVADEEIAGGLSPVYDRMQGLSTTLKSQNGKGQTGIGSMRLTYLSSPYCTVPQAQV